MEIPLSVANGSNTNTLTALLLIAVIFLIIDKAVKIW
jgi:hypothetical protein